MIILDTNVLSALMRDEPDALVVEWLDRQPADSIWTTVITCYEIRMGLALLPAGRRRNALSASFRNLIEQDLDNRVLEFDLPAANEAADLAAERRKAGQPGEIRDTQIAGIALARRATLATRNTRHVQELRISIIDPWQA